MVVGDVAILDPGEVVPSDGVFLYGYNVRCDESSITGESDVIKKVPYEECRVAKATGHLPAHADCFVISGSKVVEGVGKYLIIAVGELSCNGRIMMGVSSVLSYNKCLYLTTLQLYGLTQRIHLFKTS